MIAMPLESPPVPLKLNSAKMRELRAALGITQVAAAERAGQTVGRWNDMERGLRTNITLETLGVVASVLECEPATLLIDDKPTRKRK